MALGVMLVFAALHLVAPDVPALRRMELVALDEQMRLRGSRTPGPEIVLVMIDDASLADIGRWPVPRAVIADVVRRLHRAGARTIGIDILFADRETAGAHAAGAQPEDGDAALAAALAEAGDVALPFAFRFAGPAASPGTALLAYTQLRKGDGYRPLALAPTSALTPLPELAERALLGHIVVAYDVDGAPRYDYPVLAYDLDYYPSMAVRVVQHYLRVPWGAVSVDLGNSIMIGSLDVPTDRSTRLLVNYLGPSPAFPTYGLSQLLSGAIGDAVFRDRIVLIGANALGTRDTFQSPFTSVMPGVERLATVVDSMLRGDHLRRPAAAPWLEGGAMLAASVLLGLAVSRFALGVAALAGIALVATFAAVAQIALARGGVWVASAVPMLAIIVTFIALSLYRYGLLDRERRHIRRVFQRYLAPAMVERVVANPTLPELGGETRELTVLFCDMRGFTALSEALDPATLTVAVNSFLQAATDAILDEGGTVDKYVGDAVMAFWNAPLDQSDHALRACRAALRIQANLAARNRAAAATGAPRLDAGIGINTGPCTVGNFGSAHRLDYSAVGDTVNIAARLESATRSHDADILLGPQTAALARGLITRPIGAITLRGRTGRIDVHALLAEQVPDVLYHRDAPPDA